MDKDGVKLFVATAIGAVFLGVIQNWGAAFGLLISIIWILIFG